MFATYNGQRILSSLDCLDSAARGAMLVGTDSVLSSLGLPVEKTYAGDAIPDNIRVEANKLKEDAKPVLKEAEEKIDTITKKFAEMRALPKSTKLEDEESGSYYELSNYGYDLTKKDKKTGNVLLEAMMMSGGKPIITEYLSTGKNELDEHHGYNLYSPDTGLFGEFANRLTVQLNVKTNLGPLKELSTTDAEYRFDGDRLKSASLGIKSCNAPLTSTQIDKSFVYDADENVSEYAENRNILY